MAWHRKLSGDQGRFRGLAAGYVVRPSSGLIWYSGQRHLTVLIVAALANALVSMPATAAKPRSDFQTGRQERTACRRLKIHRPCRELGCRN